MNPRLSHRKRIPLLVKLQVALRALGYRIEEVQWDHDPPLALREWDPAANDTSPPANDANFIRVLSIAAHREKTTGRRGESKLSISGNGDVSRIRKAERLSRADAAFQAGRLTKEPRLERPKSRWPKHKMQSRPFPKSQEGRPR